MSKPFSKPVSQDRSRRTREKLLKALEALLREKDFDAISVSDLASEAGVAVGTVYRRFENKEALIPLLFELWEERSKTQMSDARIAAEVLAETDLRILLRDQMRKAYAFVEAQAHILRAVYLQARLRPDLISEDWQRLWRQAKAGNLAFLELVKDRIARTDLDRAAEMIVYQANSSLLEKALFGDVGAGYVMSAEGEAFADEMADTLYGYLMLPEAR